MPLTVAIRVRPGASRTAVGGRYGDDALVVAVTERAVDGAANRAVLAAAARAFCVGTRDVEILSGMRGRSKLIRIDGDEAVLAAKLAVLLGS